MAGYSKRSLAEKLGIKPGTVVTALAQPPAYVKLLAPMPADVTFVNRLGKRARFVHCFVTRRAELQKEFPAIAGALADDGMVWLHLNVFRWNSVADSLYETSGYEIVSQSEKNLEMRKRLAPA